MAKSRKTPPEDLGISEEIRGSIYESTRAKVESLWYASVEGDVEGREKA